MQVTLSLSGLPETTPPSPTCGSQGKKKPNSLQFDPNIKFISNPTTKSISSHAAAGTTSYSLLMTCRILVSAPDNFPVEVRALLDSAFTASFVSVFDSSSYLPRSSQTAWISGVAGLSHNSPLQSIANFTISPVQSSSKRFDIAAIVIPRVTCDLPLHLTLYRWTQVTLNSCKVALEHRCFNHRQTRCLILQLARQLVVSHTWPDSALM